MKNNWFLKTLGPGLLFASTAIGVSHLVQSTRAGASYGLSLLFFILIANLFKYPFFEFASRYANATGTSIIDGYNRLGKSVLYFYIVITFLSMFFITAAVGAVSSGFLQNLFMTSSMGYLNHIFIFILCGIILTIGKYDSLDYIIKIISSVLFISTIVAFILVLNKGPLENNLFPDLEYTRNDIFFIIALMGWMPTAVDLSSWNSLWTIERIKQSKYKPSLKETLFEFNFGYILTALLSFCFLTLGAFLMYGYESIFSNNSAVFANQVISLYTETIGNWSYLIISLSGFSIMFGTCIAVFDGYSRSMNKSIQLVLSTRKSFYNHVIWLLIIGSLIIITTLGGQLKQLIDLATTVSFIIAPFVAIANYKLVSAKYLGNKNEPKPWLKTLAIAGIIYLVSFCVIFLYFKLI